MPLLHRDAVTNCTSHAGRKIRNLSNSLSSLEFLIHSANAEVVGITVVLDLFIVYRLCGQRLSAQVISGGAAVAGLICQPCHSCRAIHPTMDSLLTRV